MGTIKQGILGGFSGKVAGVVGSSWKGIAVMKALPLSVANPKTAGQVAQRTKFAAAVALGSSWLAANVKPLWDRFAQQASGYNDFVSANIQAFNNSGNVNLSNIIASRGSLVSAVISQAEGSDGTTALEVAWTDLSGQGNALATDEVFFSVFNDTNDETKAFNTGFIRSDLTGTVQMDLNFTAGDDFGFYLSFRRPDGTIVSDSVFAQGTVA